MKIILKEDVQKLGSKGDVVDVADGYARNYLLPRKLAVEATKQKLEELKRKEHKQEKKENEKIEEAQEKADKMSEGQYEFKVKAGEEGKLFGSVTTNDIAERLKENGFNVDKKDIKLEENIKSLGVHNVTVQLFQDVAAEIKVNVKEE
mgnify:CR=1 FL=1